MCGIAGAWEPQENDIGRLSAAVATMAKAIRHRGPDDTGFWTSADKTLCLAHQRLSIQDLSELGHQPMISCSGRYVIVFNGEIYNFKRLSSEIQKTGFKFRGHSDTEVMLAAFDTWGIEPAIKRFDGMFAFVVYDTLEKELWLARDRIGEKPLYYSVTNNRLVFCSELKGLLTSFSDKQKLDSSAIGNYFRFGYFSANKTPFLSVRKLAPGAYIRLTHAEFMEVRDTESLESRSRRYWDRPTSSTIPASGISDADAIDKLETLLCQSIRDQSIADVNVGVFLSGGIDSSLVAALLQKESDRQINTYTIAFNSKEYNEAPFAKEIANHLGSNHTEIPMAIEECMDVIKLLPQLLDEPFADASIIPSYLVCQAARRHVTVCLSGDGGDELFGGYNRYLQGDRLSKLKSSIPSAFQQPVAHLLGSLPEHLLDALFLPISYFFNLLGKKPEKDIGAKIHKISRALKAGNEREVYATLLSFWHESPLLHDADFPSLQNCITRQFPSGGNFAVNAMECDLDFYLVCDNLFKVDRAAMANSLEVRLPLLDRSIVEYAATLPTKMKINQGTSKWILRQVLYKHVPQTLIERPKMGFSVPLASWFRNGLQSWGEAHIMNTDLLISSGLNPKIVQQAWQAHQRREADNANCLWTVLSYLQWWSANTGAIAIN